MYKREIFFCPEVEILLEGVKLRALVDTGSKITCIASDVFKNNYREFKSCPKFPVVGLKAVGFSGDKSIRLKTQFLANVKIGNASCDLNVMVVPRLIKDFILGIDALVKFEMSVVVHESSLLIGLSGENIPCFINNPSEKPTGGGEFEIFPYARENGITINLTDVEVDGKLSSIEGASDEVKRELRRLIFNYEHIFSE